MNRRRSLSALLALSCATLVGAGATSAQPACRAAQPSEGIRLGIERRADNGLIFDVVVEQPTAAPLYLEYGTDQLGWLRTPTSGAASELSWPLVRLRPRTEYQVRAFSLDGAGCPTGYGRATANSGPLPQEFDRLVLESTGQTGSPLTMMDVRLAEDDLRWLIAVDQDGRIVWYYPIPRIVLRAAAGRGVNGLIRLSSGNLLYLARNFGLEEISSDSRLVRRVRLDENTQIHHDLLQLPDGRVLFIGVEERVIDDTPNGGPPDLRVRGDTLNIVDLDLDYEERVWSIFDTHDVMKRNPLYRDRRENGAEEWTHANSIDIGPAGNVLLSIRYLDQVISLSPDLKQVQWRLGGSDSSFQFPDETDRFYAQHSVTQLPNGNLLMFDNGNYRPEGEYSRGLEIELDYNTMTARKVWEYRHQPDFFSASQSNALRLPSGNTLVNFGWSDEADGPVLMVEARPDGTPAAMMNLRMEGQRTSRYRVYPFANLAGEMMVQPTAIAADGREAGF